MLESFSAIGFEFIEYRSVWALKNEYDTVFLFAINVLMGDVFVFTKNY